MRIILSAYDCSPDHGSEAGLGWNWVMCAARYEDFEKVHVITIERYQENIERYIKQHVEEMGKIEFHFLPLPLSKLKKLNQRFKYIIWQGRVAKLAQKICDKEKIDFVHHVTWATCVLPTRLYRVKNTKFVYGPIGGGERIPPVVNLNLSKRDAFVEHVRNGLADVSALMPSKRKTYKNADLILVTTNETRDLVPKKYRSKVKIMQSIGINILPERMELERADNENFVVFLAARMLCWKGIDIAIEVFRQLKEYDDNIVLKVAGSGRNFERYQNQARDCENIQFMGDVPHSEMDELYRSSDLLLNCSLHDSGCMVVLEAMSHGLPIVAINAGGPGVLISDRCAIRIEPSDVTTMTGEIKEAIVRLKEDGELRQKMSRECLKRVESNFLFSSKYEYIIGELQGNRG